MRASTADGEGAAPLRVLVVEDSPADAELAVIELEDAGMAPQAVHVDSLAEVRAQLEDQAFDVILTDWNLGSFDGYDVLRLARQIVPDVPVVVLSGAVSEERLQDSLGQGAVDYVLKGHPELLPVVVSRALLQAERMRTAIEEAKGARRRLELVLEALPVVTWTMDSTGQVEWAEGEGLARLGLTARELEGSRLQEHLAGTEAHEDFLEALNQASAGGRGSCDLDWRGRTFGTQLRRVSTKGGAIQLMGVALDRTEQARLEARVQAAARLEAIWGVAGSVAHDFRNLLAVVMSCAESLADGMPEGDPRKAEVTTILDVCDRGAELARCLLKSDDQPQAALRPTDLNRLALNSQGVLVRSLQEGTSLSLDLSPRSVHVEAERVLLERVLLNLVINAQDAMPGGGVVELGVQRISQREVDDLRERAAAQSDTQGSSGRNPDRSWARLWVRDSGMGIAPGDLQDIFVPFFSTKGAEGTGLGLSSVYAAARQFGGDVYVESQVGEGSTFSLVLPLLTGEV